MAGRRFDHYHHRYRYGERGGGGGVAKGTRSPEVVCTHTHTHSISMIEMFTGAKVVSVNRGIRGSFWIDVVSLACDV